MSSSPAARVDEARSQVTDLETLASRDLATIWSTTDLTSPDAAKITLETYWPELLSEYWTATTTLAADLYDDWREARGLEQSYAALVLDDISVEKSLANMRWALGPAYQSDPSWGSVLDRLDASLNRQIGNAHRTTIATNADGDPAGTMYARHASANACSFCRKLATRGAAYLSARSALTVVGRGTEARKRLPGESRRGRRAGGVRERGHQHIGQKFHDRCHCTVVTVFPGETYELPPYAADWFDEF